MLETYDPAIDLASVERCWPVSHPVPQLIRDFAETIKDWPQGAIGYFSVTGNRFDDYWIELGGELSEQFGTFLSLPDGTRVSLWFHESSVAEAEPVIELGSEGELKVLAPNLKAFLLNWDSDTHPHDLQSSPEEATDAAKALRSRCVSKITALTAAQPDPPAAPAASDLPTFMSDWQTMALSRLAGDPVLREIAALLKNHLPLGSEASAQSHMHLRVAGSRIEIQTNAVPPDYKTFVPLPEREAMIPLILQAREERAKAHPERGLWHSASLTIDAGGLVMIKASWEFEPDFREGGRMTRAEFDADLAQFLRSPRWREPWMDELV